MATVVCMAASALRARFLDMAAFDVAALVLSAAMVLPAGSASLA